MKFHPAQIGKGEIDVLHSVGGRIFMAQDAVVAKYHLPNQARKRATEKAATIELELTKVSAGEVAISEDSGA
jgi:hypothetical protein